MNKMKFIFFAALLTLSLSSKSQEIVQLRIEQPEALIAFAAYDTTICVGHTITLGPDIVASGGTGNYVYSWEPAVRVSDPNIANPETSPSIRTTFTLSVTDENGCTASSQVIVNVNLCTEIETINLTPSLSFYPNPNKGSFIMSLNNPGEYQKARLFIINYMGQSVYEDEFMVYEPFYEKEYKLQELKKGIYFVQLRLGNKLIRNKLIIN